MHICNTFKLQPLNAVKCYVEIIFVPLPALALFLGGRDTNKYSSQEHVGHLEDLSARTTDI